MATKELTAKVRIDASQAHKTIDKLITKINKINEVVNKPSGTSGLEKKINKAVLESEKLKQATLKTKLAEEKLTAQKNKSALAAQKVNEATVKTQIAEQRLTAQTARTQAIVDRLNAAKTEVATKVTGIKARVSEWLNKQKQIHTSTKSTGSALGTVASKLKTIVGAYLGLQGAKLGIETSDTITSAQNRLNNIEGGNPKQTAETLDKVYAAAQRARTSYKDLMGNVSKTMALASDSFQGNIDNAIRFQEIMAKAYTVGGASATEASTSMYQLVQALGSGTLAGDELRSVREGAPLAYKAIEKYAQGVFKTEESLKDLAAQGVITSDIVVAAIMDMEEGINKSFENTQATFAQTWDKIKNMATKSFEPALEKLNKLLNSEKGQRMIEGFGVALSALGSILFWVIDAFATFFNWCANNWEWLKYVVVGILVILMVMFAKTAIVAIANALMTAWAWLQAYWPLLLIVAGIMAILYVYELWRQGTIALTEAIVYCLLIIAAVALIAGIIMMSIPLLIAAAIVFALALIAYFFEYVAGAVTWFGLMMRDVGLAIANFFIALWNVICTSFFNVIEWIVTAFQNMCTFFVKLGIGLGNSIKAIASNIGIAFENAWIGAKNKFWEFIQGCLEGIKFLEPAINAIAKVFGKEGFTLSGVIDTVSNKQQSKKSYQSVSTAWSTGWNSEQFQSGDYGDIGDAWKEGLNTFDVFQEGWSQDYFNVGFDWGSGVMDSLNDWGSQFQTGDTSNGIFSDLGKLLGVKGLDVGGNLPNPYDPALGLGDAYDPGGANDDILKGLDELNGTTNGIKDAMDLEDDDLEYLRKIAEMEWRKEFTTAEIRVDMTNYNNVEGERDLDGMVEYLGEVLRSEMTSIAEGVHY